jgi:hypothetical protein
MVCFKVVLSYSLKVTERSHKNPWDNLCHGKDSNRTPPKYKLELFSLESALFDWLNIRGFISLYSSLDCQQFHPSWASVRKVTMLCLDYLSL